MYKNIFVIFGGSLLAQIISLLSLPLLTRLYSAESFGLYSSVLAISSILLIVSMGRYEQSLIQINKISEKHVMFVCALLLLIAFFSLISLLAQFALSKFEKYNYVPIIVLFYGIYTLFEKKINSESGFSILSKQKLIKTLCEAGVAISIALTIEVDFGLIIGLLVGLSVSILYMLLLGERIKFEDFKLYKAKLLLNKYSSFPKYNMPHAMVNTAVSYLPIIAIPYFFDNKVLGFYALAMKLLQTPLSLLSMAIFNVVAPKIANDLSSRKYDYKPLLYIFFGQVALVLMIIGIMIVLPGERLFSIVFSDKWSKSYDMMKMMLPWVLMTFIAMPFSCVTNIFHKQKTAFHIENLTSLIKIFSLVFGGLYLTVEGMLTVFSIASSVCVLFVFGWYIYILKGFYA